jgi:hypothetical protein
MNSEVMVALGKLISKDMPEVASGKYKIDQLVTLRVKAEVTKGESYTVRPTTSMPWLKVVKYILKHTQGDDAQAAMQLAAEAVAYCLDEGNSGAMDGLMQEVDDAINSVVEDALDKLPRATRSGATKVSGQVEILEMGTA